jgi:hypothetical protein
MGLYGQRVGCFSIICASPQEAAAVESQMKAIARPMYSNPPVHGALLVATVLQDEQLKAQWYQVGAARGRVLLLSFFFGGGGAQREGGAGRARSVALTCAVYI